MLLSDHHVFSSGFGQFPESLVSTRPCILWIGEPGTMPTQAFRRLRLAGFRIERTAAAGPGDTVVAQADLIVIGEPVIHPIQYPCPVLAVVAPTDYRGMLEALERGAASLVPRPVLASRILTEAARLLPKSGAGRPCRARGYSVRRQVGPKSTSFDYS